MERISLADTLASGDLESFIAQEEAEGRMADRDAFERRLGSLIKAPQPKGPTQWRKHTKRRNRRMPFPIRSVEQPTRKAARWPC